MVRFREILKDTIFEDRINLLIDDAENNWLRDLGKNDFIHSNNILNNLDRLVPNEIKINKNIFDKAEIFLLLYAVYLHDIGRSENEHHHEKETYHQILDKPTKYGLKNEFEAYAIAEVCYGHAKESEKSIKSIRTNYGIAGLSNKPLNLQFLAALLRLADEVDNAYTRVQGVKDQKGSIRKLIRYIGFDTSRWIIEFQSEPVTWKDWIELKNIRNYTQTRLDEIKDILELNGLLYYQIWLDPKDFSKIQTPKPEDIELEELKRFVGRLLSDEPYYDKKCCNHTIDIYYEEQFKGQSYRNAVFLNKEIDEDLVYGYKEIFINLKSNDEIEQGLVVVEKINEEICKVARSVHISVITVYDLVQKVATFSGYLKNYINLYEETPIFKKDCYIPLTAVLETKEDIGVIDDYLDKWLRSEGQLQLTILGDYGTGKSTVAKRLAYRQAKRYLDNPTNERIPILIELKNYQKSVSIESLITDLLINKYSVEIKNFNIFKHLNEAGKLLLILDGFDEMATRVDYKITLANFREFDKLISENSKLVLTCRTHYFKNQDEIHKLHEGTEIYKKIDEKGGYAFLFLNPFKEDDFITYLKKFFSVTWNKYYQTIVSTYNLRELAEKPILLELMVETLPQIKIDENEKLNHASLYDRYTKFWLQRDDWRSYLKSNEREIITEEIAFYLFIEDKDKISYENLPKLIQEQFPDRGRFEIEYLDQDVRTCTFLNRDDKGDYSFVHQSFMEFFVAEKLANEIKNKNSTNFKLKKLSPQIAGFLMNLANETKNFQKFIEYTKNKSFDDVKYLGGNSATILNLLGTNFTKMDMSSTILVGANFDNAELKNSNLSNAIFGMKKDTIIHPIKNNINFETNLDPWKLIAFLNTASTDERIDKNIRKEVEKLLIYYNKYIVDDERKIVEPHLISKVISDAQQFDKLLREYVDVKKTFIFEKKKWGTDKQFFTTFFGANLQAANLRNCDLREVGLKGANLRGASLVGAKIFGNNLSQTDLRDTDLRKADLRHVNLAGANLSKAILIRANLNSANLSNANLMEVDLREANLIGTRLIGANYSKADLKGAIR